MSEYENEKCAMTAGTMTSMPTVKLKEMQADLAECVECFSKAADVLDNKLATVPERHAAARDIRSLLARLAEVKEKKP